ncbi:MAG: ABC transporter permease [Phycisphaerae bacterium]|nr:ABC transporter permease [Phycisphaerae bacterium]
MILQRFGAFVIEQVGELGRFARFSWFTLIAIFSNLSWARWSRLGIQLLLIGTKSVPVIALVGAFIGAILAIEMYASFATFGQEHRIGAVVNISIAKQIGPVLAAVMLAGRIGCSLTAELGSMRVTDQLDAMRVMAADPVRVLVAPRVIACTLMIPILTIASNLCGVFGAWLVTVKFYHVAPEPYWNFTEYLIDWFDVVNGLTKSVFFGAAIGLISCYKGFHCRAGAQGVGRATTEAFVTSFVAIVMINLVLAKMLNDVAVLIRD